MIRRVKNSPNITQKKACQSTNIPEDLEESVPRGMPTPLSRCVQLCWVAALVACSMGLAAFAIIQQGTTTASGSNQPAMRLRGRKLASRSHPRESTAHSLGQILSKEESTIP